MNYKRIYDEFIVDRLSKQDFEGYAEKHHIKPRSLGGSDEADNIIRLTASDHFFAHALLARIYKGKMVYALLQMLNFERRNSNKQTRMHYQYVRSNLKLSEEHKLKISISNIGKHDNSGENNPMYGKTHTNQVKGILSKCCTKRFSKKILQFTKDDKFIREYDSLRSATRINGFSSHTCISNCCLGNRKSAFGFIWRFKDVA
jgi:hypothetical protein